MSRTFVPPFDEPLDAQLSMETLRQVVRDWLVVAQGDCDKASTVEDSEYYQGFVDATTSVLHLLTGRV